MRYLIVLIAIPLIQLGVSILGQNLSFFQNSFFTVYGLVFLQQVCSVFLPTYFLFHKTNYLPQEEYKSVTLSEVIRFILIGIALQFAGISMNLPINVMLQQMGYAPPSALPMATTLVQFLFQTIVICLTPAVFEEVLFRRMIFNEIKQKSVIAAVCFSALFFAMAHLDFYNLAATFFIGCFLGIARTRGVPLILCIIAHFFVNFSASVLNHILKHPVMGDFAQRYFPLWIFISFVILITIFPKKKETNNLSLKLSNSFFKYTATLLKNPLFYGYLILFTALGVQRL